jgi:ubiquinone/menaquinone biosynthesis C-methylase UbiE
MNWGEEPEFFGPRHYFRESLIVHQLKKGVGKGAMILDAGSGNGSLALRLGGAGFRVLGIDASEAFVTYAENRAKQLSLNETVSFRKGDLLSTDLADETIDAVVSGEVLEHLEEDEKAVREYFRVLRQGGCCIVTVPAQAALWDVIDEWAGHLRRYEKKELEEKFRAAGFSIDRSYHYGFPLVRLYHRAIYLPMTRRKRLAQSQTNTEDNEFAVRMLRNQRLHRFISFAFHFDHLFNRLPFGIGLCLVARKKKG